MNDFDRPLTDLESAHTYFQAMGGSAFHMHREYPERYREYRLLNISREQEIDWIKDLLERDSILITSSSRNDTWWIHSRMDDLVRSLKSPEYLEWLHRLTKSIEESIPTRGKLLISETINGRQDFEFRPGSIFLSFDLGRPDLAIDYARMAMQFGELARRELSDEISRAEDAISRTTKICEILKIDITILKQVATRNAR